jgi:hypothetical protein
MSSLTQGFASYFYRCSGLTATSLRFAPFHSEVGLRPRRKKLTGSLLRCLTVVASFHRRSD